MARPVGRPAVNIDLDQLEKCAEKQWSITEIAAFFRVTPKTIYQRQYLPIIQEARQRGLTKLRDLQWKRALEGSDTMIKHMSEHYLGQHAKQKIDIGNIPDDILAQEAERRLNESTDKDKPTEIPKK